MLHPREDDRLASLKGYNIIDTPRDPSFDRLTFLAAQILKVPVAAISFVDSSRVWFKARVGLTGASTQRVGAPCALAILQRDVFVVEDARTDVRFIDSDWFGAPAYYRFYAGAPLVSEDGLALGTIFVVDRQPRRLMPEQRLTLLALAREAESLLYPHRSHSSAPAEAN